MKKSHAWSRGFFVFKAPPLGLISNQVYAGFAKLYELRAFMNIDGNKGIQAQCWYSKETHPNPLLNQNKVEESMPRKKGTPNKTTADSKRVIVEILEGQSSNLEVALKEVFESENNYPLESACLHFLFVLKTPIYWI